MQSFLGGSVIFRMDAIRSVGGVWRFVSSPRTGRSATARRLPSFIQSAPAATRAASSTSMRGALCSVTP
jgi:hypothetical protein